MRKILFVLLAFLFATHLFSKETPNIILVIVDDLGYGELGCYGNTFNETPNIDNLATQGMRFTDAYASGPICSPTRASIIAGQVPARVGISDYLSYDSPQYLRPEDHVSINEALSSVGYYTGFMGKWHLDTDFVNNPGSPEKHGFDEVIATETKYIGDGDYFFPYDKINTITTGIEDEFLSDRLTDEAMDFVTRNKEKSFYLQLSYFSVHTRLDAPTPEVNKYKAKYDEKYGDGAADAKFEKNDQHYGSIDNPYLAAMLEKVDNNVGRLMSKLDELNLSDNTLLLFFSDNGGDGRVANNGGLRSAKGFIYEGGIRECFIVRYPGVIEASSTCSVPVASVDFYPTFVDFAEGSNPTDQVLDGTSFVPILTQETTSLDRTLFWYYPAETSKIDERKGFAMRSGDYKIIYWMNTWKYELYDLSKDKGENINIINEDVELVDSLKQELHEWLTEAKKPRKLVLSDTIYTGEVLSGRIAWDVPKPETGILSYELWFIDAEGKLLQKVKEIPIGISDMTFSSIVPVGAVALGVSAADEVASTLVPNTLPIRNPQTTTSINRTDAENIQLIKINSKSYRIQSLYDQDLDINVYDMKGKNVWSKMNVGANSIIDLNEINPGVYIIKASIQAKNILSERVILE